MHHFSKIFLYFEEIIKIFVKFYVFFHERHYYSDLDYIRKVFSHEQNTQSRPNRKQQQNKKNKKKRNMRSNRNKMRCMCLLWDLLVRTFLLFVCTKQVTQSKLNFFLLLLLVVFQFQLWKHHHQHNKFIDVFVKSVR